jgi:hypothetical protein
MIRLAGPKAVIGRGPDRVNERTDETIENELDRGTDRRIRSNEL